MAGDLRQSPISMGRDPLTFPNKAREITQDPADLKDHQQPPNVFERLWTPLIPENPIMKLYRVLLRELKDQAEIEKRGLSACQKCMTVFYHSFPECYHLHVPSEAFKTAVHSRVVRNHDLGLIEVPKEEMLDHCFQHDALMALAKEAGAYEEEDGVEYIRLLRVCKGQRHKQSRTTFDRQELCENCDIEVGHEEVANTKFRVASLAKGLLAVIIQLYFNQKVPAVAVKPNHHGAGLEDLFQRYRSLVPEFNKELLFRAFLIAFGQHVRSSIKRDSDSHPEGHWWRGSKQSGTQLFADCSEDNCWKRFNTKGREKLAHNLAGQTFKVLDLFFTVGKFEDYLTKHAEPKSTLKTPKMWEESEDEIDDSLVDDVSTHDGEKSVLGHKQRTIPEIPEHEVRRRKEISVTMLAKRSPERSERPLTNAEKCKRSREEDKKRPMTAREKNAKKEKQAQNK